MLLSWPNLMARIALKERKEGKNMLCMKSYKKDYVDQCRSMRRRTELDFRRLFKAFFAEIESKFT